MQTHCFNVNSMQGTGACSRPQIHTCTHATACILGEYGAIRSPAHTTCHMQAAAALAAAFPPRGLIRLLSPEHTEQGKPRIERLVAEEYILDTMHYFDGDRLECAVRLANGERSNYARP